MTIMNDEINIIDLIQKGTVLLNVEGSSPKEVYKNVVDKIVSFPRVTSRGTCRKNGGKITLFIINSRIDAVMCRLAGRV